MFPPNTIHLLRNKKKITIGLIGSKPTHFDFSGLLFQVIL
jgi:hypothetical protein